MMRAAMEDNMDQDQRGIEDAVRESESKKKELERIKGMRDAALKLEQETKEKAAAAERERAAADESVASAELAAQTAGLLADARQQLADGKKRQADLTAAERALQLGKQQGASADSVAALERELEAAKKAASSESQLKALSLEIEKHEAHVSDLRARAEWQKRLLVVQAQEPAALQRQAAALSVHRKAVADVDQASAALAALRSELQDLKSKLEVKAAPSSGSSSAKKTRVEAPPAETATDA